MKPREEILGKMVQNKSVSWVTSILESGGGDRIMLEEMVSKRMEKNMIISTAAERIWPNSASVHEKHFWQTWKRSNILTVIKGICERMTAVTKVTEVRNTFPLGGHTRQGGLLSWCQRCAGGLSQWNKARKTAKTKQVGRITKITVR